MMTNPTSGPAATDPRMTLDELRSAVWSTRDSYTQARRANLDASVAAKTEELALLQAKHAAARTERRKNEANLLTLLRQMDTHKAAEVTARQQRSLALETLNSPRGTDPAVSASASAVVAEKEQKMMQEQAAIRRLEAAARDLHSRVKNAKEVQEDTAKAISSAGSSPKAVDRKSFVPAAPLAGPGVPLGASSRLMEIATNRAKLEAEKQAIAGQLAKYRSGGRPSSRARSRGQRGLSSIEADLMALSHAQAARIDGVVSAHAEPLKRIPSLASLSLASRRGSVVSVKKSSKVSSDNSIKDATAMKAIWNEMEALRAQNQEALQLIRGLQAAAKAVPGIEQEELVSARKALMSNTTHLEELREELNAAAGKGRDAAPPTPKMRYQLSRAIEPAQAPMNTARSGDGDIQSLAELDQLEKEYVMGGGSDPDLLASMAQLREDLLAQQQAATPRQSAPVVATYQTPRQQQMDVYRSEPTALVPASRSVAADHQLTALSAENAMLEQQLSEMRAQLAVQAETWSVVSRSSRAERDGPSEADEAMEGALAALEGKIGSLERSLARSGSAGALMNDQGASDVERAFGAALAENAHVMAEDERMMAMQREHLKEMALLQHEIRRLRAQTELSRLANGLSGSGQVGPSEESVKGENDDTGMDEGAPLAFPSRPHEGRPFSAARGFVVYFDWVRDEIDGAQGGGLFTAAGGGFQADADRDGVVDSVSLVYSFYDGGERKSDTKILTTVPVEGSPQGMSAMKPATAALAIKRKFVRVDAIPSLKIVMELVSEQSSLGWALFEPFNLDRELRAGLWAVPVYAPPIRPSAPAWTLMGAEGPGDDGGGPGWRMGTLYMRVVDGAEVPLQDRMNVPASLGAPYFEPMNAQAHTNLPVKRDRRDMRSEYSRRPDHKSRPVSPQSKASDDPFNAVLANTLDLLKPKPEAEVAEPAVAPAPAQVDSAPSTSREEGAAAEVDGAKPTEIKRLKERAGISIGWVHGLAGVVGEAVLVVSISDGMGMGGGRAVWQSHPMSIDGPMVRVGSTTLLPPGALTTATRIIVELRPAGAPDRCVGWAGFDVQPNGEGSYWRTETLSLNGAPVNQGAPGPRPSGDAGVTLALWAADGLDATGPPSPSAMNVRMPSSRSMNRGDPIDEGALIAAVTTNVKKMGRPDVVDSAIELWSPGDGVDLYIDGARCLPDNVTFSAVTVRMYTGGREMVSAPDVMAMSTPVCDAYNPEYDLRYEWRAGELLPGMEQPLNDLPPSTVVLVRVDTIEVHSVSPQTVGYTLFPLFVDSATGHPWVDEEANGTPVLNTGSWRLPLHTFGVNNDDDDDELTWDTMDNQPRVPCAGVLIRVVSAVKNEQGVPLTTNSLADGDAMPAGLVVPAPRYRPERYQVLGPPWSAEELLLIKKRLVRPMVRVEEMIRNMSDEIFEDSEEAEDLMYDFMEASLGAEEQEDGSLGAYPPPDEDLDPMYMAAYDPDVGVDVTISHANNLPVKGAVPIAIWRVIPDPEPGTDDDPTAGITWGHVWTSAQRDPRWRLSTGKITGNMGGAMRVLVIDLLSAEFKKGKWALNHIGWTAVPLFSEDGYVSTGKYKLPVLETGGAAKAFKKNGDLSEIRGPPEGIIEGLAKTPAWHLIDAEVRRKKSKLKFVTGASVTVSVTDGHWRGVGGDILSEEDPEEGFLPRTAMKEYKKKSKSKELQYALPIGKKAPPVAQSMAQMMVTAAEAAGVDTSALPYDDLIDRDDPLYKLNHSAPPAA